MSHDHRTCAMIVGRVLRSEVGATPPSPLASTTERASWSAASLRWSLRARALLPDLGSDVNSHIACSAAHGSSGKTWGTQTTGGHAPTTNRTPSRSGKAPLGASTLRSRTTSGAGAGGVTQDVAKQSRSRASDVPNTEVCRRRALVPITKACSRR